MEGLFFALVGLAALVIVLGRLQRKGVVELRKDRVRRGAGHALLGLQEFIEPSVESVFAAQNVEQKQDEDDQGLGGDDDALRADLADALGRSPVDLEEVRRHLTAALRAGMDWKALFAQSVRDELAARPYRAPSIPPVWRVSPRE